MKNITIIGSGFAGLTAVRQLRKRDKHCKITLISPRAELQYLPSLIWVPSGLRKREDIIVPLHKFFKRMNVNFHPTSVTGLREGGRVVKTDNDDMPFRYQYPVRFAQDLMRIIFKFQCMWQ